MADTESMQAAANAVFNTKELLEMVLLELPMADVLRLQRTCTTWLDVIKTRVSLQRKLYLAPLSPSQQRDDPRPHSIAPRINPLFAKKHPIWPTTETSPWSLQEPRSQPTAPIYPSSTRRSALMDLINSAHFAPEPTIFLFFRLNGTYCSRFKPTNLYSEKATRGSWRDMLITRDPSVSIVADLYTRDGETELGEEALPPGSTMGDVFDWLQKTYTDTVGSEEWRDYILSADDMSRMDLE